MFIGREKELLFCQALGQSGRSTILIVHGRRRVGKTTLIEKAFHSRSLIKIEGLEQGTPSAQLYSAVQQLAPFFPKVPIGSWRPRTWGDFFRLLRPLISKGKFTLFFEEYQWLSGYRTALTAELKLAWDNYFSRNPDLLIVLCGSSPSFMVGKVLRSKALHNRAQHELRVNPFEFNEARSLLPKRCSLRDAFSTYLLVGGIPEYLNRIKANPSLLLSFWRELAEPNGFFADEFKRIIVSSLAENPLYEKTLRFLAAKRYASRPEIAKALKIAPGGTLSVLLGDLESSGFIESYIPIDKTVGSLLCRYRLADPFIRTHFAFIDRRTGRVTNPPLEKLRSHLGYAFESYCRKHADRIAKILGFSGIAYTAGSYFSRTIEKDSPGFQLDLVFKRADGVHTVCEIKFTDTPVGTEIIRPYERASEIYKQHTGVTIHRVLISAAGAEESLLNRAVFDRVLGLEELVGVVEI